MSSQLTLEIQTTAAATLGHAPGVAAGASGSVPFCFDLADCPELRGPLMGGKSGLIVPDWDRLAKAYADANWKWCSAKVEDYKDGDGSMIPSAHDLRAHVEECVAKLGREPGDYHQFGGMIIFRTRSGGVGVAIDWLLVEHYRRSAPNTD